MFVHLLVASVEQRCFGEPNKTHKCAAKLDSKCELHAFYMEYELLSQIILKQQTNK